jgi:hypothetical protein
VSLVTGRFTAHRCRGAVSAGKDDACANTSSTSHRGLLKRRIRTQQRPSPLLDRLYLG